MSTRRVDELVQAMGLSGIGKSTVSKLCKARSRDERVTGFLERPLEGEWPYLWLAEQRRCSAYLEVREGGRIVSVAAIIAVAVDTDEQRRCSSARDCRSGPGSFGSRDLLVAGQRRCSASKGWSSAACAGSSW